MKASDIKKRFEALETERSTVEDVWRAIKQYVVPFRGDFFKEVNSEHSVEWRDNRQIYDSTAISACSTLAASIHGSLTSPAIRWFELKYRLDALNDDKEAAEWLENAAARSFEALQDSNFNLEANETYLDLVSFGESGIIEEAEEKNGKFVRLMFQSVPVDEFYFDQDYMGRVLRAFRVYKWDALQILSKFGEEHTPGKIKEMAADEKLCDQKMDVIFCIYPRKGAEDADTSKILAPKERPFGFKYVIRKDCAELGEEGGYYEMPAFMPRWRKTSGSKHGHGPALIALPDILTVNQLVELILKATEKVIDPANKVTERGLLSDLDLSPGGLTVVRTMDSLEPHESKARFDVSQLQREELQRAIRSIFYVDQLELKESPAMTATEVQTRYELMQRLLGPTLGRLQSDYLDPLVQRTFNILYRAGEFGDPPEIVLENGGHLDIVYTGPLVRAQRADIAQGVTRWIASLAELSQVPHEKAAEVLDNVDFDQIAKELANLEGVPAKLMASEAVIKKIRKAREEERQRMAEAMAAQEEGAGLEAMGKGQAAVKGEE